MNKFKAIIAYDGTSYKGWQIQKKDITIAGTLIKHFKRTFNHDIVLLGASRTDAGVHALGQTARIITELPCDIQKIQSAWNKALPPDIVIRSLERISNFHPCVNVKEKTYYYTLFLKRPLPFIARYGWFYDFIKLIDLALFEKLLHSYIGTHDFASFCKWEPNKTTIRTITDISLKKIKQHNALLITVKGPGFARFQIRRMIGYALDIARISPRPLEHLRDLLNNPNHEQTFIKADGAGLCLRKIVYQKP